MPANSLSPAEPALPRTGYVSVPAAAAFDLPGMPDLPESIED